MEPPPSPRPQNSQDILAALHSMQGLSKKRNKPSGGGMVLAWHTNIATRWLDPLQRDGSATPDNFLLAVHDTLIKNYKAQTLGSFGAGRPPARPGESATFVWSERDIHYLQAG